MTIVLTIMDEENDYELEHVISANRKRNSKHLKTASKVSKKTLKALCDIKDFTNIQNLY